MKRTYKAIKTRAYILKIKYLPHNISTIPENIKSYIMQSYNNKDDYESIINDIKNIYNYDITKKLVFNTIRMFKRNGDITKENNLVNRKVLCIETNKIYNSITDALLAFGKSTKRGDISDCCNGKSKTAFGYHWRYVDYQNTEYNKNNRKKYKK